MFYYKGMNFVNIRLDSRFEDMQKRIARMLNRIDNPEPALMLVGKIIRDSVDENFESEGRPISWAPNSIKTIEAFARGRSGKSLYKKSGGYTKRAAKRIASKKVLHWSTRLRKSINFKVSGKKVFIGTNVEYAAAHQYGLGVPQRKFIMIQPEDMVEIIEKINTHILS